MNWAQTWRIAEQLSLAEVGDRLVIRRQPADQPHHFHIAPGLPLELSMAEQKGTTVAV